MIPQVQPNTRRVKQHTKRPQKVEKSDWEYWKVWTQGPVPGPSSGDVVIAPSALSDHLGDVDRIFENALWTRIG